MHSQDVLVIFCETIPLHSVQYLALLVTDLVNNLVVAGIQIVS